MTPLVLVVLVGPQASGKSTLAAALAAALRQDDERVALVELDQIAEMALPTLPGWGVAHTIFESVVGQWARASMTCVIAAGSGSRDEVVALQSQAPASVAVVTVAVTTAFPIAFARAQQDASRELSRQHGFLSAVYDGWPAELTRIDADLVIDTDEHSVEQEVALVRAAMRIARSRFAESQE